MRLTPDGVSDYSGLAGIYLSLLLKHLLAFGQFDSADRRVLDFGCGTGKLAKTCKSACVIGFDIIPELTQVEKWQNQDFDTVVCHHVLYALTPNEILNFCDELQEYTNQRESSILLVTAHSRQSWLNKFGMALLQRPDAHKKTKVQWEQIDDIVSKQFSKVSSKNFFGLSQSISYEVRPN